MARSRDSEGLAPGSLILGLALAGCVTSTQPVGPPRVVAGTGSGTVISRNPDGSVTRDSSLQVTVAPLPTLDTDGFRTPLLSPDGTHLAWQTRSNADWPMLLAQKGASTAINATVATRAPEASHGLESGPELLLGRMAVRDGVLVESPQADGSRRVGLLPWDAKDPRWLPEAAEVRAFACVGPRGEWGYGRRALDAECFDLVVERPEGRLEFPRREGESWSMPVVATDGVYACSLRDGILELAFLPLRPGERLTRSQAEPALIRHRISIRATPRTAYQAMAAVAPDAAATPEGLLFFHPDLRRMAAWSPRTGRVRLLAEGSVSARPLDGTSMLVTLPGSLVLQEWPPQPALAPLQVLPGLWISCGRSGGGTLLAGPREGTCSLSRLRLGTETSPSP